MKVMNRPGFRREWGAGVVAHKGYWDRHARHFLLTVAAEDWLVEEECGGCYVALYELPLRRMTAASLRNQEHTP